MVNHLRTLLLNDSGPTASAEPLEEYVPPGWTPPNLSGTILEAWKALFGLNPDRCGRNLLLRRLLPIVHGTAVLSAYGVAFDSRLSYWPSPSGTDDFSLLCRGASASSLSDTKVVYLSGRAEIPGSQRSGVARGRWQVLLTSNTDLVVERTSPGPARSEESTLIYTNGLSQVVGLHGSSLGVKFSESGSTAASWSVEAIDVRRDLSVAWESVRLSGLISTICPEGSDEPYGTFSRLALSEESPVPIRLAAFALALAWRIEELRTGGLQ